MITKIIVLASILFTSPVFAVARLVSGAADGAENYNTANQAITASDYYYNSGLANCLCKDTECELNKFSGSAKEAMSRVASLKTAYVANKVNKDISFQMIEYLIAEQYVKSGGDDNDNCLLLINKREYPINKELLSDLLTRESSKFSQPENQ